MLHEMLPYFWVDMSVYPGNSGGPLIEDGKLVGVVSAQADTPIDSAPNVRIRVPFAKVIKARHLHSLLETQAKKDCRDL